MGREQRAHPGSRGIGLLRLNSRALSSWLGDHEYNTSPLCVHLSFLISQTRAASVSASGDYSEDDILQGAVRWHITIKSEVFSKVAGTQKALRKCSLLFRQLSIDTGMRKSKGSTLWRSRGGRRECGDYESLQLHKQGARVEFCVPAWALLLMRKSSTTQSTEEFPI